VARRVVVFASLREPSQQEQDNARNRDKGQGHHDKAEESKQGEKRYADAEGNRNGRDGGVQRPVRKHADEGLRRVNLRGVLAEMAVDRAFERLCGAMVVRNEYR